MKYYTVKEMAKLLNVSVSTVKRYGKQGKIGTLQPCGRGYTIRYFLGEKQCQNH